MCQRDIHYYATLALCVRAGYSAAESRLIAWSNFQTDCWSGTQVKWPWQILWPNPGPYFHFVEDGSKSRQQGQVEPGGPTVRWLVAQARTPVELGIALHSYQDSYSHEGFVGRISRRNEMGLTKRWLPPYGHTQLMKIPDRCECQWTDSRTGKDIKNCKRFGDALRGTSSLLMLDPSSGPGWSYPVGIGIVLLDKDYDRRKRRWAAFAGMPDIRFSGIQAEMWSNHKKEFKAAAARQKRIIDG